MTQSTPDTFAAFVGIDWADAKHDVCLQAAGSSKRACFQLDHTPAAIDAWVTTLRTRFNGSPIAVCLERTKGSLVFALRKDDFLILFPLNPLTLARYREAFTPSRAKDDPTDAALQLELLLTHRDKLQPLNPQSPAMRAIEQLVEQRRRVVGDKVRSTHRLTSTLKNYFPQVLQWFPDKDTPIFCDFLSRWPTLKAAQLARRSTLETFFRDHHVRSADIVAQRLHAIKAATPLTTDEGVIAPHAVLVQALVNQLRVTLEAIATFDTAIAQRAQSHPDFPLFQALPGAGPVFASRLLVAFGEQRERYATAAEFQKYAGIAPVTERSGKKAWVHWRLQCPTFLRQTFVEWAAESIRHSFWARVYYQQQRDKGKAHQAAVRALAFKWIRILSRCWQDRTLYDESVYLNALNNRGSSLIHNLAQGS
ncbi:MAG TPA: IS110 family transposase [Candidatus Tectomicrobia bacterium]|nr:IS110 family transposase [Candidatus Tectomicrobia bacterium]